MPVVIPRSGRRPGVRQTAVRCPSLRSINVIYSIALRGMEQIMEWEEIRRTLTNALLISAANERLHMGRQAAEFFADRALEHIANHDAPSLEPEAIKAVKSGPQFAAVI